MNSVLNTAYIWATEPGAVAVEASNRAYAPQPNCQVNADATKGHAFGIFMALGCTLRPHGLRRRLPW